LALITLRSRPLLLRTWSSFGLSAPPLRVAAWRANDLWPRTRHLHHITGRSSPSPTTSSIAATAALSLPLRKSQVNHAPRVPHLRRTAVRTPSFNARRRRSSHQDLGSHPEQLLVVGHHFAIDFSPPTSHVFARTLRTVLVATAVRIRAVFSSSSQFSGSFQDNGSVSCFGFYDCLCFLLRSFV
jgi:hypothetical protein